MSKDMKNVSSYHPGELAKGCNFLWAWMSSPQNLLNRALFLQYLVLVAVTHLWMAFVPASNTLNIALPLLEKHMQSLTPFVLGLFISLMIAKTYYANRGMFGTLFGRSVGFSQMVVSWVRAPTPQKRDAAIQAKRMLVRWTNAAFRLMVLECKPGVTAEMLEEDMLQNELLTDAEWAHIKNLPSRCTHIYQWMNNVLLDLLCNGFIQKSEGLLKQMHMQIEEMRGANVFGLPSLPMPYTMVITLTVKAHLYICAMANGSALNLDPVKYGHAPKLTCYIGFHAKLFLSNLLYQGMLDLHGLLYNPNSGDEIGHLPVVNFLEFVNKVSGDLVEHNEELPYKLDLESGCKKTFAWSGYAGHSSLCSTEDQGLLTESQVGDNDNV
jgi:hypothetical protein